MPDAPTASAVAGDGGATVSWTVPASGTYAITGHVVTPVIDGTPQPPRQYFSSATTALVVFPTNGVTYTFTVAAVNGIGTGMPSGLSNGVTPAPNPPQPPIIGSAAAAAGDGEATVSWTRPTRDGGSPITGYEVTPYIGFAPQTPKTFNSTATTETVSGLTNGTTYRFRVRAINAVGLSDYSKVTNPVAPTPA